MRARYVPSTLPVPRDVILGIFVVQVLGGITHTDVECGFFTNINRPRTWRAAYHADVFSRLVDELELDGSRRDFAHHIRYERYKKLLVAVAVRSLAKCLVIVL